MVLAMRVTMTWTGMELSMARITVHLFTTMVRGTLTVLVWGMLVFKIVMVMESKTVRMSVSVTVISPKLISGGMHRLLTNKTLCSLTI